MDSSKKIKVLIADDHAIVREGLNLTLSRAPDLEIVGEVENGLQVLERVKKGDVDVVLLDMEMPEKNGWETLLQLKASHPKIPVIILTIFPEKHFGTRLLDAGASGYLNKASSVDRLLEAIRTVFEGGIYLPPSLAEVLYRTSTDKANRSLHENLSKREFQIFFMIISGTPLKQIAEKLSISTTTVSTHRAKILEKMDLKNNADLILYAVDHGLIKR